MRIRIFSVSGALAVLLLVLAACQTAGFRASYTALDSQGLRKRGTFFTDSQSIFCIGELVSARDDVTVSAIIKSTSRYDATGQLVPIVDVYGAGEMAPGKTTLTLTAFSMQQVPVSASSMPTQAPGALPFPAGQYVCELSIDGSLADTVNFNVTYPACPAVPVAPTVPCKGWVKPGSVCPAASPNATCTCGASGLWEC